MTAVAAASAPMVALPDGPFPRADRLLFWYMALTPVWWATGLLLPLGLAGMVALFLRRLPREPWLAALTGLWALVSAMQLAAAVVNYVFFGETSISLLHVAISPGNSSWILIGMCIAIGGQPGVSLSLVARAVEMQAMWIIVLALVSLVAAYGLGMDSLSIPSPLALLLPPDMAIVKYNLTMGFFGRDELMGDTALRMSLFFPWPTALSLAGATALLVGLSSDRPALWRTVSVVGGAAGVWFGYSRSVAVCMALALAGIALLRLPSRARFGVLVVLVVLGLAANAAVVAGFDPITAMEEARTGFTNMRAGSSEARNLLYDITWRHFLERPLFGYGTYSGPVARWLPVPLGSHSSFYGVLHLGGIAIFGALCAAFAATLLATALRLADGPRHATGALAMLVTFGVVGMGENINSIVPSLLSSFVWLGTVLRPPDRT